MLVDFYHVLLGIRDNEDLRGAPRASMAKRGFGRGAFGLVLRIDTVSIREPKGSMYALSIWELIIFLKLLQWLILEGTHGMFQPGICLFSEHNSVTSETGMTCKWEDARRTGALKCWLWHLMATDKGPWVKMDRSTKATTHTTISTFKLWTVKHPTIGGHKKWNPNAMSYHNSTRWQGCTQSSCDLLEQYAQRLGRQMIQSRETRAFTIGKQWATFTRVEEISADLSEKSWTWHFHT